VVKPGELVVEIYPYRDEAATAEALDYILAVQPSLVGSTTEVSKKG